MAVYDLWLFLAVDALFLFLIITLSIRAYVKQERRTQALEERIRRLEAVNKENLLADAKAEAIKKTGLKCQGCGKELPIESLESCPFCERSVRL